MAAQSFFVPRPALLVFVLALTVLLVTGCNEAYYSHTIEQICLQTFKIQMSGIGQKRWCDWDETFGCYGDLTNCTFLIAIKLGCFWPNPPVDRFFVNVHKEYFANCSQSGRSLSDPSNHILGPFIVLPVMVTLLITALVVWRSKRNEGIV
eukprot:gi/632989054/ref/XP_007883440.1/ PREDICTED: receptor activity-modifying protein 1-like [Callorhinchus milii]